jgi:hypothetical protein
MVSGAFAAPDRARVVQLLSELDDSAAPNAVAVFEEMAADIDEITDSESLGLATESRAARGPD